MKVLAAGDVNLVIQDMNFEKDTAPRARRAWRCSGAFGSDIRICLNHLHDGVVQSRIGRAAREGGCCRITSPKPWDDAKLLATVENLLELAESGRERGRVRRERQRQTGRNSRRVTIYSARCSRRRPCNAPLRWRCRVARSAGARSAHHRDRMARARSVWRRSCMRTPAANGGPFIALNCRAVPAELIEAELFGAEAGAYTSSNRTREGRFELADGGTCSSTRLALAARRSGEAIACTGNRAVHERLRFQSLRATRACA